jgi:glycosyltransferase involved in cell wall biosynthesis
VRPFSETPLKGPCFYHIFFFRPGIRPRASCLRRRPCYLPGELYRYIADTHGAFVQPALYEAFGLTVIEAMTCGLPTFATCKGGPGEIIKEGISGFQIDPYNGTEAADKLADFFERCANEPAHWDEISKVSVNSLDAAGMTRSGINKDVKREALRTSKWYLSIQ